MTLPRPIPVLFLNDTPYRERLIRRVNEKTNKPEVAEACWEWMGTRQHHGHGVIGATIGGHTSHWMVHRLTYAWEYGDTNLPLDHLCGNPPCVNPLHLQAVTQKVNTLRGEAPSALNAQKTHCVNGHPLYGENLKVVPGRRRQCRTCEADKQKRYNEKHEVGFGGKGTRTFKRAFNGKTHCKHGHPWVEGNIRTKKNGHHECLTCYRLHKADWRRRKLAKEKAERVANIGLI